MSDNDAMSREGDSPIDALSRVRAGDVDPETLDKLRRQASYGPPQKNFLPDLAKCYEVSMFVLLSKPVSDSA